MSTLAALPLFDRLKDSRNVLIAGAGGGFDVYAGLPLYLSLKSQGKSVRLANLSFSYLRGTDAVRLDPVTFEVRANTRGEDAYFPERTLCEWLDQRGDSASVFSFEASGVRALRESYARLIEWFSIDAVVLVDGGTDILMQGDEAGLGTPSEDMCSLAALAPLNVAQKFVLCLGFGIDAYHGVCHAHFLENVAALTKQGAFLGAFSVLPSMPEGAAFVDAVQFANARTARSPSIVNGSIAEAVKGEFGDVQFTKRTQGSELFINPLMALYWAFELEAVARNVQYLSMIEEAESIFEVNARIRAFRSGLQTRPRRAIPH